MNLQWNIFDPSEKFGVWYATTRNFLKSYLQTQKIWSPSYFHTTWRISNFPNSHPASYSSSCTEIKTISSVQILSFWWQRPLKILIEYYTTYETTQSHCEFAIDAIPGSQIHELPQHHKTGRFSKACVFLAHRSPVVISLSRAAKRKLFKLANPSAEYREITFPMRDRHFVAETVAKPFITPTPLRKATIFYYS